ncbi:hypothetical protein [Okibacterium fritillariae]|uniref:Uncharacterized protein n=1 Tax=Okibacterium fritillariae TaxID=123320 RepID=A0A1T5KXB8_9MICO|nr:hypothetical protein [Okibacterium fritillariae]SKC68105.1 hypothetical protein SAMN06309945_2588 [Okibacterium fritillariae]
MQDEISISACASAPPDRRVFYRDIKPYDVPDSLDALVGPAEGTLALPHHVYWGPEHVFDLSNEWDRVDAYKAVLCEGRTEDMTRLLNGRILRELWPEMSIPTRLRVLWESRFPTLARSAAPACAERLVADTG